VLKDSLSFVVPRTRSRLGSALEDRYQIERELGAGGMATVWLADDLRHHRRVAIKVLRPELAASIGAERFLREIEIAAQLQHPHILPLFDSGAAAATGAPGEESALLWYAMPYVEGESLRGKLARDGRLAPAEARRLLRDVADALAYAHRHGVVHRDIKPENVMVSDRHALVMDFGVAKAIESGQPSAQGGPLTRFGLTVGTPTYMAPEQAAADPIADHRVDIYALGVMGYELLSGTPPFSGPPREILAAHVSRDPPPLAGPPALVAVILRCLAKDPAQRWETADQLVAALEAAETPTSGTTPTVVTGATPASGATPPPRRGGWIRLAVAFALIAAAGIRAYTWRQAHPANGDPESTPRLAVLPFQNLGSPDQEYFADGVTDEITARLAGVPGIRVVSRQSALRYKGTTKSPAEIARELGVGYLLEGTIRWQRSPDGASRVRVTPQLVRTTDETQLWADVYDEAMSEVFRVQTTIAEAVAGKLGAVLAAKPGAPRERPTTNLDAYDAYLRGKQFFRRNLVLADTRSAASAFETAVRLDSSFAEAWASLAIARAALSWEWGLNGELPAAERAAGRAAALAPDLAASHLARGYVEYYGHRNYEAALAEFRKADAASPNDPAALTAMTLVRRRQGQWREAIELSERAFALDPQSYEIAYTLGFYYWYTRQYDRARRVLARAIAIEPALPGGYRTLATVFVAKGELDSGAAIIEQAATRVELADLVFPNSQLTRVLARRFGDRLARLTSAAAPQDTASIQGSGNGTRDLDLATFYANKAMMLRVLGRQREARANFDSLHVLLERLGPDGFDRIAANQGTLHSTLGLAYAGLGRATDAVREGQRGLAALKPAGDAFLESSARQTLAAIYLMSGDRAPALDQLEWLLGHESEVSPQSVQLDPIWDPVREDPRYRQLMEAVP